MMNKYIYCSLLAGGLFLASCGSDDAPASDVVNFNSAVVKEAPDFVDPRDNTTYKCVQIGNQIWLAENLRYHTPGNSLSGCYTWDEEQGTSEYDELPAAYKAALEPYASVSDEDYVNLVLSIANSSEYDWSAYESWGYTLAMQIEQWYLPMFSWYGQEGFTTDVLAQWPDFVAVLNSELAVLKSESLKSPEMLAVIGKLYFNDAEEANGGYSSEYGMLYSYEGALAAVPEGWRLPTDEDWKKLEKTLGMSMEDLEKMEDWRGAGMATLLNEGGGSKFNAKRAGGNIYIRANSYEYSNKGKNWYFWSSTQYQENDSTSVAMIRMSAHYTDKVWRGTTRLTNGYQDMLYSVRLVKDAD